MNDHQDFAQFLKRSILLGWVLVLLSVMFLVVSAGVFDAGPFGDFIFATALMLSRICGIGAFLIGAFSIYHGRWKHGVGLFLLSTCLPAIAFHLHGTI